MKCFVVAKRIILQIGKDKRSLALLFIAPLFILFLLSIILNCTISKPNIQENNLPKALVSALKNYANVTAVSDRTAAINDLKLRKYDAFLTMSGDRVTVNVEGTESAVTAAVKKAVASSISDYMKVLVNNQKSKVTDIQNTNKKKAQDSADTFKKSLSDVASTAGKEAGILGQLSEVQSSQNDSISRIRNIISSLTLPGQNNLHPQQNQATANMKQITGGLMESSRKTGGILTTANSQLADLNSKLNSIKSESTNDIDQKAVSFDLNIINTDMKYIHGSDNMTTFESVAPIMMGFFIFFFVFIMAGVSFLRERISGTLDRLLATPVKRIEIVLGYFLGFGIFVLLQTLFIQIFMIYILKIGFEGNFFLVLLIDVLLAAGSLALGTLLSAFSRNEFQLFQFIPIVIVPQILFCGLFDLREAPAWVIILSKIFPLSYAADALTNVVLRGFGITYISVDLLILLGYTVLFLVLNSLALKKYRRL